MLLGKIAQLPFENTDFKNLQVLRRPFMYEILHINFITMLHSGSHKAASDCIGIQNRQHDMVQC